MGTRKTTNSITKAELEALSEFHKAARMVADALKQCSADGCKNYTSYDKCKEHRK